MATEDSPNSPIEIPDDADRQTILLARLGRRS